MDKPLPIPTAWIEVVSAAIPPALAEVANGVILAMFVFKSAYLIFYLRRAVRWDGIAVLRAPENKAAIAYLMIGVGMVFKTFGGWWSLHAQVRGYEGHPAFVVPVFVLGAVLVVLGLVCLLRALGRDGWSPWAWFWLTCVAVAFGVGTAFY